MIRLAIDTTHVGQQLKGIFLVIHKVETVVPEPWKSSGLDAGRFSSSVRVEEQLHSQVTPNAHPESIDAFVQVSRLSFREKRAYNAEMASAATKIGTRDATTMA